MPHSMDLVDMGIGCREPTQEFDILYFTRRASDRGFTGFSDVFTSEARSGTFVTSTNF